MGLKPYLLIGILPTLTCFAVEEIDLKQSIQKALEKSPQAIQGILNEKQAEAEFDEIGSQRLPQFFIQSRLAQSNLLADQLSDANRAVVRVEQKISPFTQLWKQADQKHLLWEAASQAKIETTQDVVLWVKQNYYTVLKLSDALERLGHAEEMLKTLLNSVIPRFTMRRSPPFDLVKVKISISDLTRLKEMTQADLSGIKTQLGLVLGYQKQDDFQVQAVSAEPSLLSLELLREKVDQNPSLKTLELQSNAAEKGVTAAHFLRLPDLLVGFDYGYGGAIGSSLSTGWEASVAARLPLWDWGTISAQVSQQSVASLKAKNKLKEEKYKILSELEETYTRASAQLADHKRLKQMLPEVHEAATASIDRYRSGGAGILETTDAVQLWVQTLLNERASFYSYLMGFSSIQRLIGEGHEIQ